MSNNSCVVVCAGGQARLFTLEPAALPELESGPNLVKREELHGSEAGEPTEALYSDIKPGRNRAPSGASYLYDDHRERHADEMDRRFAHDVADHTKRLIQAQGIHDVVLVAHDQTLGNLRNAFKGMINNGTRIREVAKDLTKLNPHELHAHLAREGLIPERCQPRRTS
ncbi:MAG: host attachment protein [Gammaproteobacteria bacterium]|nr:host attachment protein [Gammaproteobacteria bacterium]